MKRDSEQGRQRKRDPFLELETEGMGQKQTAKVLARFGHFRPLPAGAVGVLVTGSSTPASLRLKSTNELRIVAAETDGEPARTDCDEVIHVSAADAAQSGSWLARNKGILVGFSSGAAVWAAGELAKRPENQDKTILVWLPDAGKQYLSPPVSFRKEARYERQNRICR